MITVERAPAIRGKTMRWTWTDGPTAGKTHEHVFHEDGTVVFRDVDESRSETAAAARSAVSENGPSKGKIEYGAMQVSNDVYIVSYLSRSGFTLTVALDFTDSSIAGFASSATEWYPVRGTFELLE